MLTDTSSPITVDSTEGQPLRLTLRGNLTVYEAESLHETAMTLLPGEADVVVACHDLAHCDTSVLQVLLVLQRELRARSRDLRLEGLSLELRESLELAAVADTLIGQRTAQTA